jgi:hypothetical protein
MPQAIKLEAHVDKWQEVAIPLAPLVVQDELFENCTCR